MSTKPSVVLAFDVYGTLLSTSSIATQLASHFGSEKAQTIATEWRKQQLEYTWRLNSMNKYTPFSTVTRSALSHALSLSSLSLSEEDTEQLMQSYNTLPLFPDAHALFPALRSSSSSSPHITACLFSNGTAAMLSATLTQSPDLAPHKQLFGSTVATESVQRFKPAPEVYAFLVERVAERGSEDAVWVVSGNAFDVVGAKAAGLRACWVDREGLGWVDGLGSEEWRPDLVVGGLGEVVARVEEFIGRG